MAVHRSYTCLPQQNLKLGKFRFEKGVYQPATAEEDAEFRVELAKLAKRSPESRGRIKTIDSKAAERAIQQLTRPGAVKGGASSISGVKPVDPSVVAREALKNQIDFEPPPVTIVEEDVDPELTDEELDLLLDAEDIPSAEPVQLDGDVMEGINPPTSDGDAKVNPLANLLKKP